VAPAWKGISTMHIKESLSWSLIAIRRMGSFDSALVSLRSPMLRSDRPLSAPGVPHQDSCQGTGHPCLPSCDIAKTRR
jgi:hypothetical protein